MFQVLTTLLLLLSTAQIFSSESSSMLTNEINSIPEDEAEAIIDQNLSNSEISDEEKQIMEAFTALDWKEEGTHKLEQSNSTIALSEGYKLLIGEEARKGRLLTCGEGDNPELEAIAYYDNFIDVVLFENYKEGYISLNDWAELDPKSLLETISENTENANEERRKKGVDEVHVIGWLQQPLLDKQTNTIYWAIEADAGGNENLVNSIAIRLGREGYERVVWATDKSSYVPLGGHLEVMLRSHSFDPGFQYNDYTSGDKLAAYGIASLVAATLGGKMIKVGGILVLLKKFGGFAFAAIAALYYKFKNFFKSKKTPDGRRIIL
jgi:uncharacterized membrane-anchored protein